MKIFKSKRLKSVTIVLACNFLLFLYGIYKGSDLQSIGSGLALLNAPLYVYLWGETTRPSVKEKEKEKEEPKKELLVG